MPAGFGSLLVPAVRSCPPQITPGGIFWEPLSKWRHGALEQVQDVSWELYFCKQGRRRLLEGCGQAGKELKRCSEDFCAGQMKRQTNNAENRKTHVLGNDGSIPRAPAEEGGTSSMISGSHELQLLHSAPVLQPDVLECSSSPSCPDTAPAVPPCSGNAPHVYLGLSAPLSSRESFPRGQESS